jgi:lipase
VGDLSDRQRATVMAQIHLIPAAVSTIEHDIHGILARLGDVTCPVDLIDGGDIQAIMPAIIDGLTARMPGARRHTIAGSGHMVPLNHVDEVASVL